MDGSLVDTVTTDKQGRAHLDLVIGGILAVGAAQKLPVGLGDQEGHALQRGGSSGDVVTFLLYDSSHKPIGQYTSDNSGYVYIEGLTTSGRYYLRELENGGYVPDTQLKTVYVTVSVLDGEVGGSGVQLESLSRLDFNRVEVSCVQIQVGAALFVRGHSVLPSLWLGWSSN